ncbi:AAA family ATPase [Streptomyces sp. NPDC021212]|uniref:helix-turn-helix transcriptional regulator n=1 Tax=Streptomyces sp. NPDC021212 TaxID=3365118 RepID=UPI00378F2A69
MIVDRDVEISQLAAMFTESAGGSGTLAVICGGTATGKTELLHLLCNQATAQGFQALTAMGSPMEQPFPYALVEQLFPDVGDIAEHEAPATPPAAGHLGPSPGEPCVPPRVLRHVYRKAEQLATQAPLLLAIDDMQYADSASLQCLLYLIRRFRTMRISLVVTESTHRTADQTLLGELHYQRARRIPLGALSRAGVVRLVAEEMGEETAERLADEFLAVSGGNPLLLRALIQDSTHHRGPATEPPRVLISDAFQHAALACVHRSGPHYVNIAHGLALLDSHGVPTLLGELTGVSPQTAAQGVEALEEAGLLHDGRFRHPALRSAMLGDIPADTHTSLLRRATRLLHEEGAPQTVVAARLLECGPLGEDWEAPLLRAAADHFLVAGQGSSAAHCLQLASRCCSGDEAQALVFKAAAAGITWRLDPKTAVSQLQSLAVSAQEGAIPLATSLQLIRALLWNGLEDEAVKVADGLPTTGDEQQSDPLLLTTWIRLASTYPGALRRMGGPLLAVAPEGFPTASETDPPQLTAAHAVFSAVTGQGVESIAAQAELVLQYVRLGQQSMEMPLSALHALIYIDQLNLADSWCDQLLAQSAKRHAPAWDALLLSTKAMVTLRKGNLPAARDQALDALSRFPVEGWGVSLALPLATLIEANTAMGEYDAAAELLGRPLPDAAFQTRYGLHHQYARGRYHLAMEQDQAALACFLSCGEQARAWGLDSPGFVPWRSGAAEAWLRLNKPAQAAELLNEQLERAQPWQPRAVGSALRLLAATRTSAQRPGLLSRALEMFQAGSDRYNMARTLADLAQAQQQLGKGGEARQVVRRAWRLAQECGAEQLLRVLRPALPYDRSASCGGQKTMRVESLTDAERRVALLAAKGLANREVAEKLFITVSTVEQHLTKVYRKFRIKHRHQLPASLGFDDADIA